MSDLAEYDTVLPGGYPTRVLLDEATAAARGLKRTPKNKARTPANKSGADE